MEQSVVCDLTNIRGTPIFAVLALGNKWKRVFGATHVRKTGMWLFPAFYPYCADVVRDLQIVEPNIEFSEPAQKHIQGCDALTGVPLRPLSLNGYKPVLGMYEHQEEGYAFAQRMLRCALFFDMGLGKTKIVFDVMREGNLKTLVLVPSVGLGTWEQEGALHAPELRIAKLEGDSPVGRKVYNKATRERNALKRSIEQEKEKVCASIEARAAAEEDAVAKGELLAQLKRMQDPKDTTKLPDLVEVLKVLLGPHEVAELAELVAQLEGSLGPTRAAKLAEVEAAATDADVLVTTYDTAKLYQSYIFDSFDYQMIVADESQNLRSPQTARTKAALALASKAFRRIVLTGTPSLGNPMHLYGQLAFLGTYIPAKSQWVFRKHHIVFAPGSKRMQVGFKNLDMLNAKVGRVALVRKKEDCLDLPDRTIMDIPFSVSPEQRKLYNGLVERAVVELGNGTLYDPDHAATVLQKLLQVLSGFMILPAPPVCDNCKQVRTCVTQEIKPFTPKCPFHPNPWPQEIQRMKANPKMDALLELLDGIPDEKVIIWAYFREELNLVQEALEARGLEYIRIDGSNSHKAAAESKRFNEDPNVKVWLAQVSTGVAITLTGAAYTIYYGLTYRLDDYLQSMDRNFRIGQERATFVYRLFCPQSALEFVAKALAAKQDLANTLTTKVDCILCDKNTHCLKKNIEPFTKGCKYKSKMNRVITKPGKL